MAAIAPMELAKHEGTLIPLYCSLCPKKPNFSDVSHLLTHISSKTHLSNRFQTELKSKQDARAKQTLETYDAWYEQYGIEDLLQARLAAKDQKKGIKRPRSAAPAKNSNSKKSAGGDLEFGYEHDLDIDTHLVKHEPDDSGHGPSLRHWDTALYQDGYHSHGSHPALYYDEPGFHTPILRRNRSQVTTTGSPGPPIRPMFKISRSETETPDSLLPSELGKDEAGGNKLKGIQWPGMDCFDSAPEEKKRMRNQRKDLSVLKQMEETSASIEPTEQVWDFDGELQRTRDIYASPSIEGSPEPKRKASNNQKRRRSRRAVGSDDEDDAALSPSTRPRLTAATKRVTRSTTRSKKRANTQKIPTGGSGEEEAEASIAGHSHGPKNGYEIYRDYPQTSPGRTESPFEDANRFELRDRPVLQQLNHNLVLAAPTPSSFKPAPLPFLSRSSGPFLNHAPALAHHAYYGGQQVMGHSAHSTLNPLCVQRSHPFQYHSYTPPTYSDEMRDMRVPATTTGGFQPINAINGIGFHTFNSHVNGDEYDEPARHDHDEFDI